MAWARHRGPATAVLLALFITASHRPPAADAQSEFCSAETPQYCDPADTEPYFSAEWKLATLVKKTDYNHDSKVLEFTTGADRPLRLPVTSALSAQGPADGLKSDGVRAYTPISTSGNRFELLVKNYTGGRTSNWLHSREEGDQVSFSQSNYNKKIRYPFGKDHLCMLAGGTGITPMYQAMRKIFGTPADKTQSVTLIYGSKTEEDILLREELGELQARSGGKLKIVHTLSRPGKDWNVGQQSDSTVHATGWVDEEKIGLYCPKPAGSDGTVHKGADHVLILVCGRTRMYDSLTGARHLNGFMPDDVALSNLGYTLNEVYKF
eukprot:SAG22_NODE_71_length_22540_cov_8.918052_16_plen_322_part_00